LCIFLNRISDDEEDEEEERAILESKSNEKGGQIRYSPTTAANGGEGVDAWEALDSLTETELNDLAYSFKAKQEYAEAERVFRRALLLVEDRLGFNGTEPPSPSAEEAIAVNNLATVLKLQGEVCKRVTYHSDNERESP
jgi:hypothetical protein